MYIKKFTCRVFRLMHGIVIKKIISILQHKIGIEGMVTEDKERLERWIKLRRDQGEKNSTRLTASQMS